jgi:uronate dehydrogenase
MRIGSFENAPHDERELSTWLSPGDCLAAVLAAMTAPDIVHAVFYAVSHNTRRWWDLTPGQELGFYPEDDAERHATNVAAGDGSPNDGPQGGVYASPDYTLQHISPQA